VENLAIALVLAFVITYLITPLVRKLAFRLGAVDRPGGRKIHNGLMPRLGGLAVYASFVTAVLVTQELTLQVVGLLVGASLITALGVLDDVRGISPVVKLAGQVVAAGVVVPFGIVIDFVTNPLSGGLLYLGALGIPITILWVVTVTNAVNLIDGWHGLAGGISCIAAFTLAAVAWAESWAEGVALQEDAAALALILAVAVLGFMRFNFYPAKIFLGDSGSMLLGFSLSVIAVLGLAKSAAAISLFVPVIILGIPLFDVVLAVLRRFFRRKPIFQADMDHVHHRLLAAGMSHRKAVLVMYGVSAVLGASAVALTVITTDQAMLLLVSLVIVILLMANRAGIIGKRPVQKRPALHQKRPVSRGEDCHVSQSDR